MALTLAKGLRFLYLRVLTVMDLDYLPTPTKSPCSFIFFPVTDENRHEQKALLASRSPFKIRDSRDVQESLVELGDPCDHLVITQVRYFQRDVAPLHEFMVVDFKDILRTDANVNNYILLERWGSNFRAPDHALEKVQEHELADADETDLIGPASLAQSSSCISLNISSHSSHSSSVANDRFIVSFRRKLADVDILEPSGYTRLATLTPPSSSSFTMAKLAVLTACVTEDMPIYNTLGSQCFYFGRVIWEVMRMEMGTPLDAIIVAPGDLGGMKIDPLHWGSHYVKSKMADKVNSVKNRHGATAMKAKFEDAWILFDKKVRERVVALQKPILELEEERQQRQQLEARVLEEQQRSEALILKERQQKLEGKRREQALILEVQRLKAQLADASTSRS
ncbi:hypothetical protein BDP27DRAFT_1337241 [Rhodocollybia butyracea]|uniref:Uncharacterized protein n=1 Tax=Rhodocollybia butyracea TaxID=206335 RepID=A0A9P5PFY1_9AGAR|nr:hypothetical protein BDP27DRAFT_1337241 [Rhodocollybia butyracea]